MKKTLSLLLASTMLLGMLASCSSDEGGSTGGTTGGTTTPDSGSSTTTPTTPTATPSDSPTDLLVVTSYGGSDGNRQNYESAYKAFEDATGHTVIDSSDSSTEEWKAKVLTDFQTGAEPDVLFFFTGVDADSLIEGDKVVSVEEIRAEYPDYGNNMKDEMLPMSPFDGEQYVIPVNGFWEGMFVNKTVLEESGVEMPGADYTWDAFLEDCATIKDAGFAPIAAALQHIPHYWFEFTVLNNGDIASHRTIPTSVSEETGVKWVNALNDIKELYELGFFPSNTLTAMDDETVQMMGDDEAAFLIDGSWKIGWFNDNADPENFAVTYVPGKDDRAATEIIGGISMGYYITRSAWEDPDRQAAAVEFVTAMTTDEVVSAFAVTSLTALKNPTIVPDGLNGLELSAIEMKDGATGVVDAAQDNVQTAARELLFAGVKDVVTGGKTAEALLGETLDIS